MMIVLQQKYETSAFRAAEAGAKDMTGLPKRPLGLCIDICGLQADNLL